MMRLFERSRKPSWKVSVIPFAILVVILAVVIRTFGADSLAGASQIALLTASATAVAISMIFYGTPWRDFEEAISENVKSVASAILILLLIGAIAGSWMVSGVVPVLISFGMKVISPDIFLLATCVICALVSIMTGSSWTTVATIGVALIGIGTAQGFSPGWTAGAIISGAYFGDKVSPLSDTTVLASSSSGTPLFTHIRYMLITTVPSFLIAGIVFFMASIFHTPADSVKMEAFSEALDSVFNITPWLLAVPVITGILIVKKVPAMLTLFISAALAGIAALIFQPDIIAGVANAGSPAVPDSGESLDFITGFKGLMISYYGQTAIDTGNEALNSLIATRGMTGMLNTVFLIICSVTFGGVLVGSGMLQSLTDLLLRMVSKTVGVVSATVGTGLFCNMATGDQYLSIILTSSLYKKLYESKGLEPRLLSRSVEDSATVVSVLIPWNSCGMTQATVLKVPTLEYLPYCFFNIVSPLMSIAVAAVGYKIVRKVRGESPANNFGNSENISKFEKF